MIKNASANIKLLYQFFLTPFGVSWISPEFINGHWNLKFVGVGKHSNQTVLLHSAYFSSKNKALIAIKCPQISLHNIGGLLF